jgi:hypothetical protein
VHFVAIFPPNYRREAGEKPLNLHFCMAVGSADAAEMTRVQRLAPVMPPPANYGNCMADVWEQSAENANLTAKSPRTPRFFTTETQRGREDIQLEHDLIGALDIQIWHVAALQQGFYFSTKVL